MNFIARYSRASDRGPEKTRSLQDLFRPRNAIRRRLRQLIFVPSLDSDAVDAPATAATLRCDPDADGE